MPKLDFIQGGDALFAQQLLTFKNNLPAFADTFGLGAGQVAGQAADADYFAYELACQEVCARCAQQWTAWKAISRKGGPVPAEGAPGEPPMPAPVPVVAPGIEARFRALVKMLKAHPNYSAAIGAALGIEGVERGGPDFATFKPVLRLELTGGQVLVRWNWQGYARFLDLIEIEVDRADGRGFTLLAMDTTPDYLDPAPAPATAAKWTYRAIYRVGDQRMGQWSSAVSVTVAE